MSQKFYSEKQIYASTFFGGPIPPGLLIYRNFKNQGEARRAITTLTITFVFTILLFYGVFLIPESISEKIPNVVFSSLYTIIVYLVYHNYFAKTINTKIAEKENKFSNWRVAGFTFLGLLINIVIIVGMGFISPMFPGQKVTYGTIEHEIYFDEGDISITQLDDLAKTLYEYEYFSDDIQQSVRIEKADMQYSLIMPLDRSVWNNTEILSALRNLKSDLSSRLGSNTEIILEYYTLSDTHRKKVE